MQKQEIDAIVKKYELSEEEIKEISKVAYADLVKGKPSKANPVCVIIAGQPGAGKTGLSKYTKAHFPDAVMLDIDDFRFYHPNIKEIIDNYPECFAPTTNKFISKVSGYVTDMLIEGRYDVIAHKTLKNILILDDTIIPMKNAGYNVFVNAYAVNGIVSKLSAVERTQEERQKFGYNRVISNQFHDDAYNNMVGIIVEAMKRNLLDSVQVFMRGETETEPVIVYMQNQDGISVEPTLCEYYSRPVGSVGEAINIGRILDYEKNHPNLIKRIQTVSNNAMYADEKALIQVLKDDYFTFSANVETPVEFLQIMSKNKKFNINDIPSFM